MSNRQQRRNARATARPIPPPASPRRFLEQMVDVTAGGETDDVVLAWIYGQGLVHGPFAESVAATLLWDRQSGANRIAAFRAYQSSPRIVASKTELVDDYLREMHDAQGRPPRWLMMVDTDMAWETEAVHRLLAVAEARSLQVVGGLCFAGGLTRMFPTIYTLDHDADGKVTSRVVPDYPRDSVVRVDATGGAFLLVHRDVVAAIKLKFNRLPDGRPNPSPWFSEMIVGDHQVGEDVAFCLRAQACGYDVWVDTSVKVDHIKRFALNEADWDRRLATQPDTVARAMSNLEAREYAPQSQMPSA